MNKELEIWKFIAEKLKQKQIVTLLVVAESSGSSPGRVGFKMAVSEDDLCGSIGGGVMEVQLVQGSRFEIRDSRFEIQDSRFKIQDSRFKNKSKIQNPKSKIVKQVHRKNVPNSSGMICSGKQTVILKELTTDDLETVNEIIFAIENFQEKILQITNNQLLITNHQSPKTNYELLITNHEFIYKEKLGFKNKLYIIGGGHCALALSELMAKLDFHISLFDDRADLNTLEKNNFVDEKTVIESYEKIGEFIEGGENVYVVVMTLGYKFDEIVIRQLFDKDFKYFGVLGSKAKMKTLLKALEKDGFDKERLNKIRTPIGLPINSHTPEEIAVSIAAEIIAVKNKAV